MNFEGQDAPSGFSLMLDPSKLGEDAATLNDDRAAWCLSGPSQEIPSMRVSDEEGDSCSYGTPGEAGECLVGLVTLPEGPRWLCASSGSGRAGWLLLGLPALVALRRRKAGGVPPG